MLSAINSPLVAGSAASSVPTVYIRVERAFYANRVVQPVGSIIEVPKHVAAGLIASGKASAAQPPAPAVEPPPVVVEAEPAPEPKGKKHARK